MKTIQATECKDGFHVVIKETRHLYHIDDVKTLARQFGLVDKEVEIIRLP